RRLWPARTAPRPKREGAEPPADDGRRSRSPLAEGTPAGPNVITPSLQMFNPGLAHPVEIEPVLAAHAGGESQLFDRLPLVRRQPIGAGFHLNGPHVTRAESDQVEQPQAAARLRHQIAGGFQGLATAPFGPGALALTAELLRGGIGRRLGCRRDRSHSRDAWREQRSTPGHALAGAVHFVLDWGARRRVRTPAPRCRPSATSRPAPSTAASAFASYSSHGHPV